MQRYPAVVLLMATAVFLLARCAHNEDAGKDTVPKLSFSQFSGSAVCGRCHKSIYEDHIHTAHYLTSAASSAINIKGSFAPGKNKFAYDSNNIIFMERRDSGFYQVWYDKGVEKKARQFDITIGSGTRGQTYLTWIGNGLYQLPISYFTPTDNWGNSPGYLPHTINFDRTIPARCLECHTSFASTISPPDMRPDKFNRLQLVSGVDCEKCHGPGAQHVAFQTQNPGETKAKYIVNPASLTRQQNLDLCALCHGGKLARTKPSFQFAVGDTLSNYFNLDQLPPDPTHIDVHGNQYGLLRASRCFRMSNTMTCITCHDAHKNQRGQLALFSQRCITCHNPENGHACKMTAEIGPGIVQNCIDCHMPKKPSRLISVLLSENTNPEPATIRSHFISIYPDETKKFMNHRKKPA